MKNILVKALFLGIIGVLPVSMAWSQSSVHTVVLQDVLSVDVEGRFDVQVVQGLEEKAEIEAPAEVFMKMKAKQSGKSFELSIKDKDARTYSPFKVTLTLKHPEKINLEGAAKMKLADVFTCKKLSLELEDESAFDGEIRASESVSVDVEGHASRKASINAVKYCKMELSGYAAVQLNGYAPSTNLSQKDASKLEARNFRTDKLDAKLSNHATAGITVNSTLNVTVEDAAVLQYDGAPKTKVNSSGVAKVSAY
ncbi:MAG: DUF2807 domain-containing protein [Bacteroidales bacterium]|nr:DUF2807 domain-containing protein [Bacteroidales bacterium]